MKECLVCGAQFEPKGNAKTCSKECANELRSRWSRRFAKDNYRDRWSARQIILKRHHSKKKGWDFNLDESDISVPEVCPVLGIPLSVNNSESNKDDSPSIDRIDPKKGYTKGNVAVISMKANRIKNDASLEDLQKVVDWLKNQKQ